MEKLKRFFIFLLIFSITAIGYCRAVCAASTKKDFVVANGVLVKYLGKESSVTIPASITVIGDDVFANCSTLVHATIPDSVKKIGARAFTGCEHLSDLRIPGSVTSIGESAFQGCISLTGVVIPNRVTSMGKYVFQNCISLASVAIPNSVTEIEEGAFMGCSSLASVTIPNGVIRIGDGAFEDCIGLARLTMSNSVTSIENRAFQGCRKLTQVTLSNGLTKLADSIFEDCKKLAALTIPEGVTKIEQSAFEGCISFSNIQVDKQNKQFSSVDGVLFDKAGKTLLYYPIGRTQTTYQIPDGVTFIGDYAFSKCAYLIYLSIPRSVNQIGAYAVKNMTVTIQGYENTSAQRYANSNSMKFISLDMASAIGTVVPERQKKADGYVRLGWFLIAVIACTVFVCASAVLRRKWRQNREKAEQPPLPVDLFEQAENRSDAVPQSQKSELLEIVCLGCGHSCAADTKICPTCGRILKK